MKNKLQGKNVKNWTQLPAVNPDFRLRPFELHSAHMKTQSLFRQDQHLALLDAKVESRGFVLKL